MMSSDEKPAWLEESPENLPPPSTVEFLARPGGLQEVDLQQKEGEEELGSNNTDNNVTPLKPQPTQEYFSPAKGDTATPKKHVDATAQSLFTSVDQENDAVGHSEQGEGKCLKETPGVRHLPLASERTRPGRISPGAGTRMPTPPLGDRASGSAGHGRRSAGGRASSGSAGAQGSTPPRSTSFTDLVTTAEEGRSLSNSSPLTTEAMPLGTSGSQPVPAGVPVVAGSGMAPSLFNRRRKRQSEGGGSETSFTNSANDADEKDVGTAPCGGGAGSSASSLDKPVPTRSAPKSLVSSLFGPGAPGDYSPLRAGGLPLSLSPRKNATGGMSNGSFGLGAGSSGNLPSAELNDMEYQLAALRNIRKHSSSPSPENSTDTPPPPPAVPSLPIGRAPPGPRGGVPSGVKESPRGGRESKESPRSARFGRRAEDLTTKDATSEYSAAMNKRGTATGGGSSSGSGLKKQGSGGTFQGGGGVNPATAVLAPIVELVKHSGWQKQQEGLNQLRDFLRTIQPNTAISASQKNEEDEAEEEDEGCRSAKVKSSAQATEAVRQNLHDLVHGVLNICENARSSISKLAMDTIGLLCRSVSLRINGGTPTTGGGKVVGHTIDHFVEPIASKLVIKGGNTASKFLFDTALYSLRELLESITNSTRAMSGLLSTPGVKTEKSKVLWAEALAHCLEVSTVAGAQCFAGKEFVVKCIHIVEGFMHDAWADVRDGGRKVARLLSQTFKETSSMEELCFLVTRAIESEMRRDVVLAALEIEPSIIKKITSLPLSATGPPPSSAPASGRKPSTEERAAPSVKKSSDETADDSTAGALKKPRTPPGNKIPPAPARRGGSSSATNSKESIVETEEKMSSGAKPPIAIRGKKSTTPRTPPTESGEKKKPAGKAGGGGGGETNTPREGSGPTRVKDTRGAPPPPPKTSAAATSSDVQPQSARVGKAGGLPPSTTKPFPKASTARVSDAKNKGGGKKSEDAAENGDTDNWKRKPTPPPSGGGSQGDGGTSLFKRNIGTADSSSSSPSLQNKSSSSSLNPAPTDGTGSGVFAFGVTLALEAQQHGDFSNYIVAAADGNWKDRAEAMSKIETICTKSSTIIESKTAMALCDVVALRCADTNVHVQNSALSCTPVLLKCVPVDCIDATSSKWVSCLTTALGSRHEGVAATSKKFMSLIVQSCSPAETKGTLQCLSTTMVSVRNPYAKATLIQVTRELLWSMAAVDPTALVDDDDTRFLLEMGVKLLTDERVEISTHAKEFVVSLVKRDLPTSPSPGTTPSKTSGGGEPTGGEGSDDGSTDTKLQLQAAIQAQARRKRNRFLLEERAVLDHPSLPTRCWEELKEMIRIAKKDEV